MLSPFDTLGQLNLTLVHDRTSLNLSNLKGDLARLLPETRSTTAIGISRDRATLRNNYTARAGIWSRLRDAMAILFRSLDQTGLLSTTDNYRFPNVFSFSRAPRDGMSLSSFVSDFLHRFAIV